MISLSSNLSYCKSKKDQESFSDFRREEIVIALEKILFFGSANSLFEFKDQSLILKLFVIVCDDNEL